MRTIEQLPCTVWTRLDELQEGAAPQTTIVAALFSLLEGLDYAESLCDRQFGPTSVVIRSCLPGCKPYITMTGRGTTPKAMAKKRKLMATAK